MIKRILLISALIIGISPVANLTASTENLTPHRMFLGLKSYAILLSKNKPLTTLVWSSLGVICTTIAYRTMHDVYNKVPVKGHSRYLGDKILMSVACWTFAIENALEAYKSYKSTI